MLLYKFRALQTGNNLEDTTETDLGKIIDIINNGFYCNDFLGFNDMNEGVYFHDKNTINITLKSKKEYKICSFSGIEALNSELMWGHYANAGKGIVIEIDVSDKNPTKEVSYRDCSKLKEEIDILSCKSKVWEYENEYRYLSADEIPDNKVEIGKITKIYFGTPYKSLINYDEIKETHDKLKKYHKLKKELEKFCKEKSIDYEDFEFKF